MSNVLQINNSKFLIQIDTSTGDMLIFPRDVYYPGQPAFYVTLTEAHDLRDLLALSLQIPERSERKKPVTGEQKIISTDTDGPNVIPGEAR